jgi:hypothetical protein
LLNTWLGGISGALNTGGQSFIEFAPEANEWATKSFALPPGTTKIIFRGISSMGNNLYLDNIIIGDQAIVWNGSASTQWSNMLNWTPNIIPALTHDVVIPASCPHYPVVSASIYGCMNLVIKPGAILTISSGMTLTINGNLTLENNEP